MQSSRGISFVYLFQDFIVELCKTWWALVVAIFEVIAITLFYWPKTAIPQFVLFAIPMLALVAGAFRNYRMLKAQIFDLTEGLDEPFHQEVARKWQALDPKDQEIVKLVLLERRPVELWYVVGKVRLEGGQCQARLRTIWREYGFVEERLQDNRHFYHVPDQYGKALQHLLSRTSAKTT